MIHQFFIGYFLQYFSPYFCTSLSHILNTSVDPLIIERETTEKTYATVEIDMSVSCQLVSKKKVMSEFLLKNGNIKKFATFQYRC